MILERHRFRGGDSVGALHPTKDVWDPCESIRGGRRTVQRPYHGFGVPFAWSLPPREVDCRDVACNVSTRLPWN